MSNTDPAPVTLDGRSLRDQADFIKGNVDTGFIERTLGRPAR